jgi:hypothetical protein
MPAGSPGSRDFQGLAMTEWFDLMGGFDFDAARSNSVDLYRIARLALLKTRAEQIFAQTDASAREVEEALENAMAGLRSPFGTKSRYAH